MERILDKKFSRRRLLKGAGTFAIGAAGITAAVSGLGLSSRAEAKAGLAEKWPWPYAKLDPERTAEIAYTEWYRLFCGGAVISSVFNQLREKVGEPYTSFPIDAFIFLEGGIAGWGTICGTNAGANIVTNLIVGPRTSGSEDGMLMGSESMEWYANTSMPTFTPKAAKAYNIQSQHNCTDCHGSNVPVPPSAKL